jgi:hypothetical protein
MAKTKYPVTTLSGKNYDSYVWLNKNELIFSSNERRDSINEKILHRWRKDAEIETIVRFAGAYWCAGNDVIAYESKREKTDGNQMRFSFTNGLPGKWTESSVTLRPMFAMAKLVHGFITSQSLMVNAARQSPFDCRWVESEKLSGAKNSIEWIPLLEGDGYIKLPARGTDERNLAYFSAENASATVLPIEAGAIQPEGIRYFPFRGAYFISAIAVPPRNSKEPPPACIPTWWFSPKTARVQEKCERVDAVNDNAVIYAPSKVGTLRAVRERNTAHGYKPGGIYLTHENGSVEKIFEASINDLAVAPDGCSVAFRHESQLSVVQLCQ